MIILLFISVLFTLPLFAAESGEHKLQQEGRIIKVPSLVDPKVDLSDCRFIWVKPPPPLVTAYPPFNSGYGLKDDEMLSVVLVKAGGYSVQNHDVQRLVKCPECSKEFLERGLGRHSAVHKKSWRYS